MRTSHAVPHIDVPKTVAHDGSLPFIELGDYRFHIRTFGDPGAPPLIVIHGGPGGDMHYLLPMRALARHFFVVFYDQRGTGLSPRVPKDQLTLEQSLQDLHAIISHFGKDRPVRLLGHSWGAMLVIGFLGRHPELVSHAVAVEPGILTPDSAREFVCGMKASQSIFDVLPMVKYMLKALFVPSRDGHERFDYVMTQMMNHSKPGAPYQCEGQAMPSDAFLRAGFTSFNAMLKPVFNNPSRFHWALVDGIQCYKGRLLMLSSECSFIGYRYQEKFHLPLLPNQTVHVEGKGMGHNMLTLNWEWSASIVNDFLNDSSNPVFQSPQA